MVGGRLHRVVAVGLVVAACGGGTDSTPTTEAPVTTTAAATTSSIDEGRMVSGSGGASALLPPGSDDLDVMVEALDSLDDIFPTGDPAAFAGGVELQPHGATFEEPVIVTIPLTVELEPGRTMRLYHWDGEGTVWEETSFLATVQPDGMTAVAEVTHFSYYVLQPSAIGADEDGIFGNIEATVSAMSRQGIGQAEVTRTVFERMKAHVNARFPLLQEVPLDVPVVNGYNCYAPVGIFFVFDHGSEGVERPLTETIGDIDDVEFRIDYVREVDVSVRHLDPNTGVDVEYEVVGTLAINVYWRSQPPELETAASRPAIWAGESVDISGRVSCGGHPMKSLEVDFELLSDPTQATLSETLGFTGLKGGSKIRVETTDLAAGLISVRVGHFWTDQKGDVSMEVTEVVQVAVGGVTGVWRISGKERWSGCTLPEDNGTYSGSGEVTFVQEGDTFYGFGKFPRTSDLITGTVQRSGQTGFVVEGSVDYVERYEGWTVTGTATFTGRGSILTQSIDFTWRGGDTFGDTCTFTGEGTGTRK